MKNIKGNNSKRIKVPQRIVDDILFRSDHKCCLCNQQNINPEIHHIDGNSSNNDPDNLIPLCPNCHSIVEQKGGKGRTYSPNELRKYRDDWFEKVVKFREKNKMGSEKVICGLKKDIEGSKQQPENNYNLNYDLIQDLSEEAKELLIEASKDPHGTVIKIPNPVTGDISLKTNGKNLVKEVGPRVKALWKSVLQELLVSDLLIEKGENVFEITQEGYQIVDNLIKKGVKMTEFTVSEVIDGDTFKVKKGWKWDEKKGDIVRPTGYDAPEKGEPGYEEAKQKLEGLILNERVEIKNPQTIDDWGRLVADVYYKGKNLADYFPEYKT